MAGGKMAANTFYCMGCRARVNIPEKNICVTTFKNGRPALKATCPKCGTKSYKLFSPDKASPMRKKYGSCRSGKKKGRRTPKKASRSRRRVGRPRKSVSAHKKKCAKEDKVFDVKTRRCRKSRQGKKPKKASRSRRGPGRPRKRSARK